MTQLPALQRTVFDLIEEYERKHAAVEQEIVAFEAAENRIGMAATVQGTFIDTVVRGSHLHAESLKRNQLKSGWKAIYNRLQIGRIANALATNQGKPHLEWVEIAAINAELRLGDAVLDGTSLTWDVKEGDETRRIGIDRGIAVCRFQNGNAHVFFEKWALLDINRALAEFYGEVLPDAEEEGVKLSASTAVSKDLQFY